MWWQWWWLNEQNKQINATEMSLFWKKPLLSQILTSLYHWTRTKLLLWSPIIVESTKLHRLDLPMIVDFLDLVIVNIQNSKPLNKGIWSISCLKGKCTGPVLLVCENHPGVTIWSEATDLYQCICLWALPYLFYRRPRIYGDWKA